MIECAAGYHVVILIRTSASDACATVQADTGDALGSRQLRSARTALSASNLVSVPTEEIQKVEMSNQRRTLEKKRRSNVIVLVSESRPFVALPALCQEV